jgi:dihydropyrimidinase
VCVHAEDGSAIERLTAEALAEGPGGPSTNTRVRPARVEASAITRAAELAKTQDTSIYVVHLSSAEGLAAVGEARELGADVHVETCPHYLSLTDTHLNGETEDSIDFVCQPPLRKEEDREALWQALADGTIEVVSTDHCPFTTTDRRRGVTGTGWSDFTQIPGGLSGVEPRLSVLHQGVVDGRLSLVRWIDACVVAPSRLFGLADRKGALAPGFDADVVVFDPSATTRLDAASLHSRSDHSPYEGTTVTGWAALTYARGRLVARDGEPFEPERGWGRFIPRRPVS